MNEASRQALEGLMRTKNYEYQREFARRYVAQGEAKGRAEGRAAGKAEDILKLLILRGITIPAEL